MQYGLIAVVFVCLLASVGLIAAAVVLITRADTFRQATAKLDTELKLAQVDAAKALALVEGLQLAHYTALATDVAQLAAKVTRQAGQIESWEESLKALTNKWTAREQTERRAAAKAAASREPEPEPEEGATLPANPTLDDLVRAGLAQPLTGPIQAGKPARNSTFGQKV